MEVILSPFNCEILREKKKEKKERKKEKKDGGKIKKKIWFQEKIKKENLV